MFAKYFGLTEEPFGATPDPSFLFRSASHREALASLYCGFFANRGFTALIAEPGMGKTTLLFEFLEHIRDRARTIFLFNTFCGPDDLVISILRDCGIEPRSSVAERYIQVNQMLTAEARAGRPVVLVVDEAQNLSAHTLEGLRLLTNFETTRSKLIQVVLAGQPQLADMLARPELAQLRQRISTFCRIDRLSSEETHAYIEHRLALTGHSGAPLFTEHALDLICHSTQGIPRLINTLCFNSLCLCRARKALQVDGAIVAEAMKDLELPTHEPQTLVAANPAESIDKSEARPVIRHASARIKLLAVAAAILLVLASPLTGIHQWNSSLKGIGDLIVSETAVRTDSIQGMREGGATLTTQTLDQKATEASAAPAPIHAPETAANTDPIKVIVAAGDTLEALATDYLGRFDSSALRKIQTLNPQLTNPDHIETGRVIQMPARH